MLHSFLEQRGFLSDIGIDPHADLKPSVMVSLQHPLRVRKGLRIPGKVAPLIGFHPVTVKVEDMQRNLSVCHPLDKTAGGLFIVVGGKRSCQPQSKGPCRRKRRFPGQVRILFDGAFRCLSIDHIIIQALSFYRKLDPFHLFAGNFIGSVSFIVQKNAVTFIGNVERNVLIGDFTCGAAVFIPHFHYLSVFHKGCEALSQTIDGFVHVNGKGFDCITSAGLVIHNVRHIPESGVSQLTIPIQEADAPGIGTLIDHGFGISGLVSDKLLILLNAHMRRRILYFRKRSFVCSSVKMGNGNLDHVFHRTGKADGQHSKI